MYEITPNAKETKAGAGYLPFSWPAAASPISAISQTQAAFGEAGRLVRCRERTIVRVNLGTLTAGLRRA